ncbi:hypothetical protein [Geobacter sp. AOG2]|uniref:hypothetical protein n=1 Tax=Geobacter sp. AOG2 TaxID=1566347 RepID=UPI001CC5E711|nr:hypothetical protein [Geobacter sp. AOG2]GFE61500.1 hypothetical protein AOG2_20870 [Geobacter sp. AOG2]
MPDLLFISDNPKLEQVKALLQPMLKLEIVATADYERALKDISGHLPPVICIQDRLAGTEAGEIAGRVRAIPASKEPLFVLLHEGDSTNVPPEQPFGHVIDLNQPVEQIAEIILHVVLRPAFQLHWNEIYIPHGWNEIVTTVPGQKEPEPAEANATPPKVQIPAELLKAFEHNYHSRHRNRWIKYAAVSLTACLAVLGWYATSARYERSGSVPPTALPRPVVPVPVAAPAPQSKRSIPPTPVPSAAAVVQKAPSAAHKPIANKTTIARLPSFIPERGRDSAYSRQKPGWERYTNTNYEFRILRSGSRIKAIQVLAATQHAISEAFVKSVLNELTGSSTYRETSQTEEQGFLIKRGSARAGVTILIYTQKSRIRAFVISIS